MSDGGGPLLEVDGVSIRFGALLALSQVSLTVNRREIVAIIGPNGAGKTTLLNAVSGFYHPYEGRIAFEGRDRTYLAPPDVAGLGIARTFQNVALFKGMRRARSGCNCHRTMVLPRLSCRLWPTNDKNEFEGIEHEELHASGEGHL